MAKASQSVVDGRRRRVLVVDDDPEFAASLCNLLTIRGYEVEAAHSPGQAEEILQHFDPQIALLDVRLGRTSGFEFIASLKERRAGIACIMVSAYAEFDSAVEALRHGAENYLRKPLHPDELLTILDNCFERIRLEKEKQVAEKALDESRARLRGLVDNSPSAICLGDMAGRFRLVNRQFEKCYGLSAREVNGKNPHDLFPSNYADSFVSLDREVIETSQVIEREFEVPFADRNLHSVVVTKFPVFGGDSQATGIGTIITDVTDHVRAEDQLRQAQKMEAVGQLTGGVAHDFNNLLTIVMGNLELLSERLADDDGLARYLESAQRALQRGADLTQRLLAYSRKQSLDPKAIDLNKTIGGMIDLLSRTLGETVEIETVYGTELWNCRVDPAQVENAVLNLAINARDAMPGGGKLIIETANADLDDDYAAVYVDVAPGHYVMLSMTDTGPGMTPEVVEHAFEPFYTTKETGKGSGLGLSMIYGFVKQSGGHVKIYSELGHGTAVKIYLPRVSGDAVEEVKRQEVSARDGAASGTVLVVEDDIDVLTLAVTLLGDLGYRVLEAKDGPSALDELDRESKIDLLFTDVVLPGGMTGRDLAEEARRRRPEIKVLYTSGYTENVMIGDGKVAGNAAILTKPYRKRDLDQMIRTVLEGRPGGRPSPE